MEQRFEYCPRLPVPVEASPAKLTLTAEPTIFPNHNVGVKVYCKTAFQLETNFDNAKILQLNNKKA